MNVPFISMILSGVQWIIGGLVMVVICFFMAKAYKIIFWISCPNFNLLTPKVHTPIRYDYDANMSSAEQKIQQSIVIKTSQRPTIILSSKHIVHGVGPIHRIFIFQCRILIYMQPYTMSPLVFILVCWRALLPVGCRDCVCDKAIIDLLK